jgi:Ni/Fe-hydrogenase subunit HybB-like protein
MTLGVKDLSPRALHFDERMCHFLTIIGIPSAFLLHGYVGFIFGSIKANPWWGTVLMPIIFIFSAMVSGIAMMACVYVILSWIRRTAVNSLCLETIIRVLLSALVLDAAIEALDWIHRLYEAEESIDVLVLLASGKLYYSFLLVQVLLGTVLPMAMLSAMLLFRRRLSENFRKFICFLSSVMIVIGVFAMRWNVVIGGQLFSKSLRGFTAYKVELVGQEGLLTTIILLALPLAILGTLVWLFLPKSGGHSGLSSAAGEP